MLTVAVTTERSRGTRGGRCWAGRLQRWEERTGFITRRVITLRRAKYSRLLVPVVVVVVVGVVVVVPNRAGMLNIILLDWVDKAIVFCCGKPRRTLG